MFLMLICRDRVPVESPPGPAGSEVGQWVAAMDTGGIRVAGGELAPEQRPERSGYATASSRSPKARSWTPAGRCWGSTCLSARTWPRRSRWPPVIHWPGGMCWRSARCLADDKFGCSAPYSTKVQQRPHTAASSDDRQRTQLAGTTPKSPAAPPGSGRRGRAPLRARSPPGRGRELTVTCGQSDTSAHLRARRLTRYANRPSKQRLSRVVDLVPRPRSRPADTVRQPTPRP